MDRTRDLLHHNYCESAGALYANMGVAMLKGVWHLEGEKNNVDEKC